MLDPVSPAKLLLLIWLAVTSTMLGARLTRRFLGVNEPLDVAGGGLTFALLILGTVGSWIVRLTHHFPGAFVILGALTTVPLVLELRRSRSIKANHEEAPRTVSSDVTTPLSSRERTLALTLGVLTLIPGLNLFWRTHHWDDWYFYLPLTSAFSRGIFPVVYPFLPDRAFTYHFGFAWLAGVLEYHTGLSPEHCVDVISTVLLVIFYLCSATTFRLWIGGRLSPYLGAAMVVGFGPLAWLWTALHVQGHPAKSWFASWVLESQTTFATDISRPADYLLQKPMLAGMALVWTIMSLFFVARRRRSIAGAAVSGICTGMLELFQYPVASLATVAGGAVLALDLLFWKEQRKRRLIMLGVFTVTALVIPRFNGGFVANPQGDPIIVDRLWNFPYPGFVDYARAHGLSTLLCYLLYFGASIFFLPAVVPSLWRQRSLNTAWVVCFGLAAFTIPHVLRHRSSPVNITKFFHLSAFAVATLAAAGLLAATRRWPVRPRAVVLGACLAAMSLSTWVSSGDIATPRSGGVVDSATVKSLRLMARWLRAHAGKHDRVFALTDEVEAMSGVLSPLPPYAPGGRQMYTVTAHGYAPDYIDRIKALTDSLAVSLDDASLAQLKIRWIVLPVPLPPEVGAEARRRLAQPELFQLRHQTTSGPGGWFIYEYLRGAPSDTLEP